MRDNSKIAKDLFDARASCKHFGIFLLQSRSFCLFSREREARKYHVRHALIFQICCTKNILYWHTHPRQKFLCKYWAEAKWLSDLIDLKKSTKQTKNAIKALFYGTRDGRENKLNSQYPTNRGCGRLGRAAFPDAKIDIASISLLWMARRHIYEISRESVRALLLCHPIHIRGSVHVR
jgi:hypothetical protein